MEEDDASKTTVDAVVCTEENLPELSAVLLCVIHSNLSQPLSHAACSEHILKMLISQTLFTMVGQCVDVNGIQV